LGIETLRSFKEGLNFSKDTDVKEYIDRVIKKAISKDAYDFLKDVSIISNFNPIEVDTLNEVFSKRGVLDEVIDANINEAGREYIIMGTKPDSGCNF